MKRSALPKPQQQQSDQTSRSRPFGVLGARKSSFLPSSATPGNSRQQPEKDPRNLKDRAWQKSVVTRATLAIGCLGLPSLCQGSLQPRSIWTLKEIYTVLEGFIASLISLGQDSALANAPGDAKQRAEQLHSQIEYLGYPFTLGKQVLSSPNTPHNWPLVLGLIDYLCDRLDECNEARNKFERTLLQPADCAASASLGDILRTQEEGYAFFLQHGTEGFHIIDRLTESAKIRQNQKLQQAEDETKAASEELQQWKERAVPTQRLQQDLQELQERADRIEKELDRERDRRRQLETALPLKEAELAAIRAELNRLREDCEQLDERIRAQPISKAEVMTLRSDLKELESYIGRLDETIANTEREIGASETQLSADYDRLAQVCNQTNYRLAQLGLPQRAVPELSEAAQQANQAIEPSLKRYLASLSDQIAEACRQREESRKRSDSLTDAVQTHQARLATIRSMIEAEKASKRRSEEAVLQEWMAALDACAKQLEASEAARDRQRERLAYAVGCYCDTERRLDVGKASLSRGLSVAAEAVQQVVTAEVDSRARLTSIEADWLRVSEQLAELSRKCSQHQVSVVADIVDTGNTNLMAILLPQLQQLFDRLQSRRIRDNDYEDCEAELMAALMEARADSKPEYD